jgi:hypothetical protein
MVKTKTTKGQTTILITIFPSKEISRIYKSRDNIYAM